MEALNKNLFIFNSNDMKKFMLNITRFIITLTSCIIVLLIATSLISKNLFDFSIPKQKNILVLGNSHPECAINDSILPNVFNLAQSGTGYFYDYVKAREVIAENSQIDTVIIGYTYGDMAKEMDSWFDGKEKIKFKLRNYFFLFNFNDYLALLKANPLDVLSQTPQAIGYNLYMSYKGYTYLGGFNYLKRNKLEEAKRRLENQQILESNSEVSKYQSIYLQKIYTYCNKNNIVLILLNTPIHPLGEEYRKNLKTNYYKFASQKLPKAILVNDSNLKLPESFYADLNHLNFKGAHEYSEFLKQNKFKQRIVNDTLASQN
ncbi:MAG: hypothetical protein COA50_08065 [Flavobacteriaceae bacterium]|nr:MAG: hypothetical protein COA50_08065 [Flavobacteriaceae bacterium]